MIKIKDFPLEESRVQLEQLSPQERLSWSYEKFEENFALTTSFGIQSAVLLHMIKDLFGDFVLPVIWVDTGYLPKETYQYAEELTEKLSINLHPVQSPISPARMEAIYGKLWETNSENDLEKYHYLRKIEPLETALNKFNISCWASGVRKSQTDHRKSMTLIDPIRDRLSLRPLLNWSTKDIFYYMKENDLPQHPLFEKGYSTVGDWHSSGADTEKISGRNTRFGGHKQECGLHLPEIKNEGFLGEGI